MTIQTFWSIQLVTTDGHQVNLHVVDIDGDFTHGLRSISVKKYLPRSTQLSYKKKIQLSKGILFLEN